MQTTDAPVINVQEIEPKLRHLTIFQTFDKLQPGQSLIIHNNHDPKPVYYQLQEIRGNVFDWEYLQAGPEWWDILVTKHENAPQPAVIINDNGEIVITVPALEPRLKHETIFLAFEKLNSGKSMIIHNDHDPKPLHYHLKSMHGDIFSWEYLQEGPQWWDVKITKKGKETTQHKDEKVSNSGEVVVNVPALEPKLKHPTIFKVFDELEAGDSMIIHNDHDPKPVYYQLLGERGDIFTWEYLQQGPQWWDIRVTKKGTETTETIGEIVAKDIRKADVLKKYGIDFCCGGNKTIRQVCAEKGIDAIAVEKALQQPIQDITGNNHNYNEWNIGFLADYIVNVHHSYIRKYLPEIQGYAAKVAKVHGTNHAELAQIQHLVEKVGTELTAHLKEEENVLFPLIKQIAQTENTDSQLNKANNFSAVLEQLEKEHDSVGKMIDEIRKLSNGFAIPEDACTSYKLLYKMIQDFEDDLHIHIHLENNILFPKAQKLEKELD